MTGPEHYAEAERLIAQAEIDAYDPMRKYAEDANIIAIAQVHATLALAAATAYPAVKDYYGDEPATWAESRGWAGATQQQPQPKPDNGKQECVACEDRVYTLSSDGLCDSCVHEQVTA